MVTRREGRRTECELVTSGIPVGGSGVGVVYSSRRERGIVRRMLGANNQITRTCRESSKASLIHFLLMKEASRGVVVGTKSFRSAPPKVCGSWWSLLCAGKAHLSA